MTSVISATNKGIFLEKDLRDKGEMASSHKISVEIACARIYGKCDTFVHGNKTVEKNLNKQSKFHKKPPTSEPKAAPSPLRAIE